MSQYDNISAMIQSKISVLTKAQRRVADYIVKHPLEVTYSTVDQLAHAVGTSTTTIMRLANSLGYAGYSEFQRDLQKKFHEAPIKSPSAKLADSTLRPNTRDGLLEKIVRQQSENFSKTIDGLSERFLEKIADQIGAAKTIYVIGHRSSLSVAHYLSFNLTRIFGNCHLLNDDCVAERLSAITQEDVLIAISMPRYIKRVCGACETAHVRGAHVIAITDGYLSPLAKHADSVISCDCKSLDFHNSLCSAMLVAEIVISFVTVKHTEGIKDRLLKAEEALNKLDVHVSK